MTLENGGESGIRTHEAVLAPTRFPIVLLQPLGHLSAGTGVERALYRGRLWRGKTSRAHDRVARQHRVHRTHDAGQVRLIEREGELKRVAHARLIQCRTLYRHVPLAVA